MFVQTVLFIKGLIGYSESNYFRIHQSNPKTLDCTVVKRISHAMTISEQTKTAPKSLQQWREERSEVFL